MVGIGDKRAREPDLEEIINNLLLESPNITLDDIIDPVEIFENSDYSKSYSNKIEQLEEYFNIIFSEGYNKKLPDEHNKNSFVY